MNPTSTYTTTQGTVTPDGLVNFDPNTGARLETGKSVQVADGGNTYSATLSTNPVLDSTPDRKDIS